MANAYPTGFQGDNPDAPAAAADRGLFDCFGKKEDKEDVPMTEAEHKPSLMEKLHRSNSSSSSSSEEEVEEGGMKIRRRKKKGLTDKIKEKLPGHKKDQPELDRHPTPAPGILEKVKEKLPGHHKDEPAISPQSPHTAPAHTYAAAPAPAPAYYEAPAPAYSAAPAPAPAHAATGEHYGEVHGAPEQHEKKGIFEMIKEKLPGGHKDGEVKKDH